MRGLGYNRLVTDAGDACTHLTHAQGAKTVNRNIAHKGYVRTMHASPASLGLPTWCEPASTPALEPDAERRFCPVEALPAIIEQAFAGEGVEVTVTLKADPEPTDTPEHADAPDWADCIPVTQADFCGECGSLKAWEDFAGVKRCPKCEPPAKAERLARKAKRVRMKADRRNGVAT